MESKIRVFENQEFGKVRTLELNNEPLFVGKDIEYEANRGGGYIYPPVLLFYKMTKI